MHSLTAWMPNPLNAARNLFESCHGVGWTIDTGDCVKIVSEIETVIARWERGGISTAELLTKYCIGTVGAIDLRCVNVPSDPTAAALPATPWLFHLSRGSFTIQVLRNGRELRQY